MGRAYSDRTGDAVYPVKPVLDIEPKRLGAVDVASLTAVEVYATLVHLAGWRDPVVAEAVFDAVSDVLARTRGTA